MVLSSRYGRRQGAFVIDGFNLPQCGQPGFRTLALAVGVLRAALPASGEALR